MTRRKTGNVSGVGVKGGGSEPVIGNGVGEFTKTTLREADPCESEGAGRRRRVVRFRVGSEKSALTAMAVRRAYQEMALKVYLQSSGAVHGRPGRGSNAKR